MEAVFTLPKCLHAIPVSEASQVGEARRYVSKVTQSLGFNETQQGKSAIIATELATNLVRHANGGELLIGASTTGDQAAIDLFSIDRGPGMADPARCLADGFSTGGSQGTGLGAIQRLASEFDLFSVAGAGTILFARVSDQSTALPERASFCVAGICRPAPREEMCGDAWLAIEREGELAVFLADGLGHGPLAADAANAAIGVFREQAFADAVSLMKLVDMKLRGSRGAAAAIAKCDLKNRSLSCVGVGNIAGSIQAIGEGKARGLVSHNGAVGVEAKRIQEFTYPIPDRALILLHSDGLRTRWDLSAYPGLLLRHPGVIAGVLYRDFARGSDDLTIVVIRPLTTS